MIALEDGSITQERLLKYPLQVPNVKVISNIVSGTVDLHFSHKQMIFSDSSESNESDLRELLSHTRVKTTAYKLNFHSIKWIGVTNLTDEGADCKNYATLYLYDYSGEYCPPTLTIQSDWSTCSHLSRGTTSVAAL